MTKKFILPTTIAVVEPGQEAPADLSKDILVVAPGQPIEEAAAEVAPKKAPVKKVEEKKE